MAAAKKTPAAKPKPKAAPKAAAPKPVAVAIKKSTPVAPPPPPRPAPAAAAAPAVDHGARIAALWARLEAWVATAGAPPLGLDPPASEKAIKAAEKELALAFPPDFRASLRLHDGQAGGGPSFPWMPGCTPLLPLDAIVAARTKLSRQAKPKAETVDANGRIKGGVARPGRIPIAGNTFLDLDPGPAGVAGQLITLVTDRDLVVIDSSFAAALERWVAVLERGIWIYSADQHAVHPRALVARSGHPAGWFSKR